jgi:hypothetical protein
MFASSLYDRQATTCKSRARVRDHLSARQLAFQKLFKHLSAGAVAMIMLIALALLTAHRDHEPEAPTLHRVQPHTAMPFENAPPENSDSEDFGNKRAATQ